MADREINYKRLRMMAGIELHQQLETGKKLFCQCSAAMREREPTMIIKRKLHPVASELGEIDVATQYEYMRDRTFNYQVFGAESCLVELDEEPPHAMNMDALDIGMQIAMLLNCQIPDEIHVMRKTVTDGSNPSAFQRTAVIGRNGYIKYKGKKVEIAQISIEEDAGAIVEKKGNVVVYRLNRLGVPLVEISTGILKGYDPEEVQEIAYLIGIMCRSTGKVKHGIGSIRQDVNVSIRGGNRVEIKGIQELGLLSKVIKKEVARQLDEPKVEHETRAANPDGSTRFTRPLPGAARMYPETDVPPISVSSETLKGIKKNLPEPFTKKLTRFERRLGLSKDLAMQILNSNYLELFERIAKNKKSNPTVIANTLVSLLKDLRKRESVKTKNLTEKHFIDLFDKLTKKNIVKEAIPEILKYLAAHPDDTVSHAITEKNLTLLRKSELNKMIKQLVKDSPDLDRRKIYGIAMGRVRGRADPQEVSKIVKRLKRK